MDSRDVAEALNESLILLAPPAGDPAAAWSAPAGVVHWSCLETAAHISHDLMAYAMQLAAGEDARYLPLDLVVAPDTEPWAVLRIVAGSARLLGLQLDAAGPDARAWHWGPTDPSGFAAMAVNEILVHTWDIAQGLGLPWTPPAHLAAAVLQRLFDFPDVPHDADPDAGRTLLWATGRIALPHHARRAEWRVRAAVPLLFSYGTLRDPAVQRATFGRTLTGHPDSLPGYRLELLEITDPHVLEASGETHHPILVPGGGPGDAVEGTVFEVTAAELAAADEYEVDDYRRVLLPMTSGARAWVYVAATG